MTLQADVLILGSGFGGSLTALLAERIGLRPVLIERGSHPRFAIGESSTPQGDLVLGELARRYGLPRLQPLCKYGSWRRSYPELVCGLKRGFSYFHHEEGRPFAPGPDHSKELVVAASRDDESSDTHWLRADFDAFLVGEVRAAGIPYFDHCELTKILGDDPWSLECVQAGRSLQLRAPLVVDASGDACILGKLLAVGNDLSRVHTHSRALYAHFTGVPAWGDLYDSLGGQSVDHPFPCHAAALHHVFDGGWMYVLRFDNDVTSAGFVLDTRRHPGRLDATPEQEWAEHLHRFPSLALQFENATPITPFFRTARMQRRALRAVGPGWVMLPAAACFLDPLHSSGNALTLAGIERLVAVLEREGEAREQGMAVYEQALFRDVALLDKIIHGCYVGFRNFELMQSYAMLYFAGAHYSETARRRDPTQTGIGFLNSHDPAFRQIVDDAYEDVCRLAAIPQLGRVESARFQGRIAAAIEPYNLTGLCDPARSNMYRCD
ncbi:MAG: tryptophan 7-halogenase [Deltaproteobacteria bacterium]|nr:tryptophan 7-halogenase [Deltaproteobacteria bacterium]